MVVHESGLSRAVKLPNEFTFMHLADAFIQSDLQYIQSVPWELNPRPFALLTQCFTTEPQEHSDKKSLQVL